MTWQEDTEVQARIAFEMLSKGQVLNADHPVVVLEDLFARLTAALTLQDKANEILREELEAAEREVDHLTARIDTVLSPTIQEERGRAEAAQQRVKALEAALREIAVSGPYADRVGIARAALGEKP